MFREIMAAIAAGMAAVAQGLRQAWKFSVGIVTWPFTLFAGGSRLQTRNADMATVKAIEQKVAETGGMKPADLAASHLRDAQIAWSWVATSLLTRQQMPFPTALSRTMQSWLRGLDHGQLIALRDAGAKGISLHFTGKNAINTVPAVQPLAPVSIKFPQVELENLMPKYQIFVSRLPEPGAEPVQLFLLLLGQLRYDQELRRRRSVRGPLFNERGHQVVVCLRQISQALVDAVPAIAVDLSRNRVSDTIRDRPHRRSGRQTQRRAAANTKAVRVKITVVHCLSPLSICFIVD